MLREINVAIEWLSCEFLLDILHKEITSESVVMNASALSLFNFYE